jgi:hypothetical protein
LEDPRLRFSEDVSLSSGQMGSPSTTVLETMPLTRPMEVIQPKRTIWKWIALGGGTLLLASLAIWVGTDLYLRGPNSKEDTVTASREPATVPSLPTKIASVVIAADRPELLVREQTGLRLVAQYADGTKEEIKEGVQWSSSDPSVAVVDGRGRVEGKGVGKAEVMARYKDMEAPAATLIVTQPSSPSPTAVSAPRLVSMRIQAGKPDLSARDVMFLRLRGKYSDGQEREVKKGVHWESSDRSIAAVNAKGEVLGLKEGKVEVVARAGEITSEPLSLVIKPAIVKRREPEAVRDLPPDKPVARAREPQASKNVQPPKIADVNEYIRLAKSYRERGEYTLALAELRKAGALDPKSKEVQGEIGITRRACNAERTLGRSDLKCEP